MDIFISHDSRDDAIVTQIHDKLEAAGINAWADHHDIAPGDDFDQRVHDAIQSHDNCLFASRPNPPITEIPLPNTGITSTNQDGGSTLP
jgi:hypothetical protein